MKILFYSMEGIGHVKACLGLAEHLLSKHQVSFLIGQEYSGNFKRYGFDEIILEDPEYKQTNYIKDPIHPVLPQIVDRIQKSIVLQHKTPKEKLELRDNAMFKRIYEKMKRLHGKIKQLIEDYQPDLIVIDHFIIPPCIMFNDDIPWVFLFSGCPDFLYNSPLLPPCMSGLPSDDPTEWSELRQLFFDRYQKPLQDYQNQLNEDLGYHCLPDSIFFNKSPYLNLYSFAKELDYTDRISKPENFFQMDSFFDYDQNKEPKFDLPENFQRKIKSDDRLIYISLGSCGPIDVQLMKQIIEPLGSIDHFKCIVSKGPLHDQYELPDNMWGEPWVNQRAILPQVDLVIFHGGNNTLAECLMYGKPMIVLPLFFDQYSNAQRIQEKHFGIRLDPYKFSSDELIETIDRLLNDKNIQENLNATSQRMKQSESVEKCCQRLEKLVEDFQQKRRKI